jgi:hypothetical protein
MTLDALSRPVRSIVARAQLGDALDDVDFFMLARFADAHPQALAMIAALLAPGRLGEAFYLAAAFDSELEPARKAYAAAGGAHAAFAAVAGAEAKARRSLAERIVGYASDIFTVLGAVERADSLRGEGA